MSAGHAERAEQVLHLCLPNDDTFTILKTRDQLALAQVHATLALVEQQRIANLIAFMESEGGPYKDINEVEGGRANALTQIVEGLSLS